jgi:electron transport complex protein RnfC
MTLFPFHGGLVMERRKSLSSGLPVTPSTLPSLLVFPLLQRDGGEARPGVTMGERVLRGQRIAGGDHPLDPPIHASTSGRVVALQEWPLPQPGGMRGSCLVIEPDGADEAVEPLPPLDPLALTRDTLRARLHEAGITGMGGAGFPAAAKLAGDGPPIDTLIVNGAECEPYITCDEALLRERADTVARGTELLRRVIGAGQALIAIESDLPLALEAARAALEAEDLPRVRVVAVPVRYPVGGERQLIQTLTGREVPSRLWPTAIGILCQNVATVAAIHRAVTLGRVPDTRIVTVTGLGIREPRNLEVRLGTPLSHLIAHCGGYTASADRLILGGPMMGYPIGRDDIPVTKSVNAILVAGLGELPVSGEALPCIRCGLCADACPAQLLPQQLHRQVQGGHLPRALDQHLFDCIECGCCDAVCPSRIPLTPSFRQAKQAARTMREERDKAEHARRRFEARQARLLREQGEREEAARRRKAELGQGVSKIQATLAKTRLKRAARISPPAEPRQR